MTSQGTGLFLVWDEAHSLDNILHLSSGHLTAWIHQGETVRDVLAVQKHLADLINLRKGRFEFEPSAHIQRTFSLSISQLVAAAMASIEQPRAVNDLLSNNHTIFHSTGSSDVWLGNDVQHFWNLTERQLQLGASGQQLTELTGLPLDHVMLFLYKLRVAGVVIPHKALDQVDASLEPKVRTIRRLHLNQAIQTAPQPHLHVRLHKPEKTLLQRLLGTFSFRRNVPKAS